MKHRQARAAAAALTLSLAAAGTEIDTGTGLVMQPGWQDVRAHCGTCHSFGLVTHQRADRATWLAMIRWMQESAEPVGTAAGRWRTASSATWRSTILRGSPVGGRLSPRS